MHKIEKKFRADYLLGVASVQRVGVHLDDVPGGALPLADQVHQEHEEQEEDSGQGGEPDNCIEEDVAILAWKCCLVSLIY